MRANKRNEDLARNRSCGDAKDHTFGLINARTQLKSIQHQEDFECGVSNALVPVDERMIQNYGEAQRDGFVRECTIEFVAIERRSRLCEGGFKRAKVS